MNEREEKQELVATFEVLTEEDESDPALVTAVGHETVATLQKEGYRVLPADYTGRKGIESFLVDLVTFVWTNHAAIAEGIAGLSSLVTIFTGLLPLFRRVQQGQKQKKEQTSGPVRIIVEIDGAPLTIEASDLAQADAALQLALKYRAAHPEKVAQVTPKSKVKVQARIPPRKRRPRR